MTIHTLLNNLLYFYSFISDFAGILTGDDNLTVFADGRLVGYNDGTWNAGKWFSFPNETKVITVFVDNEPNGFGGFLGVFSNGLVTDRSWKCNETSITPDDGWEQTNLTDNTWPNAFVRHNNSGRHNSAHVYGIPKDVHWISVENHYATKFTCRRRISMEERLSNTCSSKYSVSLFPVSAIVINLSKRTLKQLHKTVRSESSNTEEVRHSRL